MARPRKDADAPDARTRIIEAFWELIVFCILIIGLRLDFRLIPHINARIVKRNLGQCDLV